MNVGNRISIIHMENDPSWGKTIKKGDKGTIISIDHIEIFNQTQVWVKFDNGSTLALLLGVDRFKIIGDEDDK